MRCCRSGLGFVLLLSTLVCFIVINPCVLSDNRVDFGLFFVSEISLFMPPPPESKNVYARSNSMVGYNAMCKSSTATSFSKVCKDTTFSSSHRNNSHLSRLTIMSAMNSMDMCLTLSAPLQRVSFWWVWGWGKTVWQYLFFLFYKG